MFRCIDPLGIGVFVSESMHIKVKFSGALSVI